MKKSLNSSSDDTLYCSYHAIVLLGHKSQDGTDIYMSILLWNRARQASPNYSLLPNTIGPGAQFNYLPKTACF